MLKGFARQFNALVLPFVLFLSVLTGFPNMARADKVVKPVLFDPRTNSRRKTNALKILMLSLGRRSIVDEAYRRWLPLWN